MIDKATILEWFSAECETSPGEEEKVGAVWILNGKVSKLNINIVYPDDATFIIIQRAIQISDEHKAIIGRKSNEERTDFIHNLKRGLISTQARWQMIFDDSNEDKLNSVRMFTRIFEDGLTRDTFVERLMRVHDASILLLVEIDRIIGE